MKNTLLLGFFALLVLLVFEAVKVIQTTREMRASQTRIVELAGVRNELRDMLAAYVDAETGQRGFLLTGSEKYLEPYHAGRAALARSDSRLRSLLVSEREKGALMQRIEEEGVRKMEVLDRAILERREHGSEAALAVVLSGGGKEIMDNIRAMAAKLDGELEASVKREFTEADARLSSARIFSFTTSVILAVALIGLCVVTRRHFAERDRLVQAERSARDRVESLLATERAAHSNAAHANKLKDEFLAVVSHELRTPLNAILGWTTLLRQSAEDPEDLTEGLDTIERNARAQARLIDDLLDVSRIISGKVRLQIKEVDLRALAFATVDGLRPAAEARGVQVAVAADCGVNEVLGDAGRLQQVMWNLVSNAIKFTPRDGRVDISLQRAGSVIAMEVADTGRGIRADFLPRIFDRFSQADGTTTRSHSGLGLGLSIARHLVELHGGTISALSAGEGKGAVFRFEIPMLALRELKDPFTDRPARHAENAPAPAPQPRARLDGLQVLMVDDQPDALFMMERVLTRAGAEVRTALSVAEGLESLRELVPHCIISDIGMPGRDGYSFIRELRTLPAPLRTVPAVALTAFARDSDRALAMEAGFDDHLTKPVDTDTLLQKVATLAHRV